MGPETLWLLQVMLVLLAHGRRRARTVHQSASHRPPSMRRRRRQPNKLQYRAPSVHLRVSDDRRVPNGSLCARRVISHTAHREGELAAGDGGEAAAGGSTVHNPARIHPLVSFLAHRAVAE